MVEMRGAFEVHRTPAGDEVFYRDSNHAYYGRIEERTGGKWVGPRDAYLPSPSTIGKLLETSNEGLLRWAARTTCEGVVELNRPFPTGDALWAALKREGLTYSDLREKRATEGTAVHTKILGCLAEGKRIPSLGDVTVEERGYAQGVISAWHDLDPEPLHSEFVIYSPTHSFAGRPDLLCKIDGKLTLLDLKTGYVGNGAHTQTAGYDLGCSESGYGDPDEALILKVDEDGNYELIPCAAVHEDFTNALAAYRSASAIGKRSRENYREMQAAA